MCVCERLHSIYEWVLWWYYNPSKKSLYVIMLRVFSRSIRIVRIDLHVRIVVYGRYTRPTMEDLLETPPVVWCRIEHQPSITESPSETRKSVQFHLIHKSTLHLNKIVWSIESILVFAYSPSPLPDFPTRIHLPISSTIAVRISLTKSNNQNSSNAYAINDNQTFKIACG